jgi:hypothetical protein
MENTDSSHDFRNEKEDDNALLLDIRNILAVLLSIFALQFLAFLWVVFHLTRLVIAP